jgi:hypothetical protein
MKQQELVLVGVPLWAKNLLAEVGAIQMSLDQGIAIDLKGVMD